MRLIDADAMRKPSYAEDDNITGYGMTQDERDSYNEGIRYALRLVANCPTVDAVTVCRCKDCKHRPIKPDDYNPITTDGFALEFPDEKCPCQCGDGWYSKYPDDDWYCPIGERKGGGE